MDRAVDKSQEIGMAEVIVRADSELVGRTVMNSRFRERTGLSVIGLRRGRIAHETSPQNEALKTGDTLLLIGPWKDIQNVQSDGKGVVALSLPIEFDEVLPVSNRIWQALFCLFLVVGLMVSGIIPNVQAALLGCLLMGALGCITLDSAYRSIDWKTIVLIVGMLPFSTALQRTGGVDFNFDNADPVCISIETRPEVGEGFAPVASMFKQFELIYVVGDERDLVRLRTNFRDEEVFLYHIRQ
jgi:di/tricarboxylate transporter